MKSTLNTLDLYSVHLLKHPKYVVRNMVSFKVNTACVTKFYILGLQFYIRCDHLDMFGF